MATPLKSRARSPRASRAVHASLIPVTMLAASHVLRAQTTTRYLGRTESDASTYFGVVGFGFGAERENCESCPRPSLVGGGPTLALGAGMRTTDEWWLLLEYSSWKEYAWQEEVQQTNSLALLADYHPTDMPRLLLRAGLGATWHAPTRGEGNRGSMAMFEGGIGAVLPAGGLILADQIAFPGRSAATTNFPSGWYEPMLITLTVEFWLPDD